MARVTAAAMPSRAADPHAGLARGAPSVARSRIRCVEAVAQPGHAPCKSEPAMREPETFKYDDDIVRKFVAATLLWGAVGTLVGLWIALQLAFPELNIGTYFTFGRLRPLHTNAVIFAFAG